MGQLIVRNLEPEVVGALKARAARRGRSTEAEHREILREVLCRRRSATLEQLLLEMPPLGGDRAFVRSPQRPRRVSL